MCFLLEWNEHMSFVMGLPDFCPSSHGGGPHEAGPFSELWSCDWQLKHNLSNPFLIKFDLLFILMF